MEKTNTSERLKDFFVNIRTEVWENNLDYAKNIFKGYNIKIEEGRYILSKT